MKAWGVFLALGMLLTGSINSVVTKLADMQVVAGNVYFNHPFFQTAAMFLGELSCLAAYWISRYHQSRKAIKMNEGMKSETSFPKIILWLPALCDLTATTLMNFGLLYLPVSIYQMLRGAMILFTALFSVVFLKHRLRIDHYVALFIVVAGIALVGLAGVLWPSESSHSSEKNAGLGIVLVIAAQAVVGTQFVVEEYFISKRYTVPALLAVGYEGFWGFLTLLVILPILQFVKIDGKPIEDTWQALQDCAKNHVLLISILGSVCSIAFFNFFGISVTKYLSATHRTTIDSCRTLFIWMFSLAVKWETFHWMQLGGFVLVVFGTFLYNQVITMDRMKPYLKRFCGCCPASCFVINDEDDPEKERLLSNAEDLIQEEPSIHGDRTRRREIGDSISDINVIRASPPRARSPAALRLRYYQALSPDIVEVPLVVLEELHAFRKIGMHV